MDRAASENKKFKFPAQEFSDYICNNQESVQNVNQYTLSAHKSFISKKIHSSSMMQNTTSDQYVINFSEKIIIVIDTVCEHLDVQLKLNTDMKYSSLYMAKRMIELFIHNKLMLNQKHEFAFITLDSQKAYWVCNFTGNLKALLNTLNSIEESLPIINQKYFDVQQVFTLVCQQLKQNSWLLQDNVVRIILFYTRSNIIPRFNIAEIMIQKLIKNHNFFFDILYFHESFELNTRCQEIYVELTKLDIKNTSYIMEAARSAVNVHNCMARLLAHPLQRVRQGDIKHCINSSIIKLMSKK